MCKRTYRNRPRFVPNPHCPTTTRRDAHGLPGGSMSGLSGTRGGGIGPQGTGRSTALSLSSLPEPESTLLGGACTLPCPPGADATVDVLNASHDTASPAAAGTGAAVDRDLWQSVKGVSRAEPAARVPSSAAPLAAAPATAGVVASSRVAARAGAAAAAAASADTGRTGPPPATAWLPRPSPDHAIALAGPSLCAAAPPAVPPAAQGGRSGGPVGGSGGSGPSTSGGSGGAPGCSGWPACGVQGTSGAAMGQNWRSMSYQAGSHSIATPTSFLAVAPTERGGGALLL